MAPIWLPCFSQPVPVPAHPLTITQDQSVAHSLAGLRAASGAACGCGPSSRARTASVSGSAPSASAGPRPHLAGATPEQHCIFLLGARAATAHRHGLLPRTLPGSPNDDFRHGASGTGRVRWPGGSQRPPTRSQLIPPTSVFSLSPLHLSSSSFFYLSLCFLPIYFPPSSPFLFIFQVSLAI